MGRQGDLVEARQLDLPRTLEVRFPHSQGDADAKPVGKCCAERATFLVRRSLFGYPLDIPFATAHTDTISRLNSYPRVPP